MKAIEIREKFLKYFKSKNHHIIDTARLIPENDPTVLFTTAGMHPLVPYLSGASKHPVSNRLADYQICLRTDDIDEVGDSRHLTFFEMLGNWSIGEYFKEDAIKYSYDFLTNHLNIPKEKLSVTCFEGDNDCPKDEESAKIWREVGIDKIYFFGKKENWWGPAGITGPCGPDTEIFYDTGKKECGHNCSPACDCGKYVEIWNNVFMQYNKKEDGSYELLKNKNVDTGLGLERMTFLLQGKNNVFETELFESIINKIKEYSNIVDESSEKIVADHLRASCMILLDKVNPSNSGQGYILRRLIRRSIRHLRKLNISLNNFKDIVIEVINTLAVSYPEIENQRETIIFEMNKEKNRFENTLTSGEKEFKKIVKTIENNKITGEAVFRLYDTFGFPPEVTKEMCKELNIDIDLKEFDACYKKHQELSRQNSAGSFKGGLADNSIATTKYHTATHLLNAALRKVLGNEVYQRGANITAERIRFDFSYPTKVEKDKLEEIEKLVNEEIAKNTVVTKENMSVTEAKEKGAIGIFDSKYSEMVSVYTIGDFSKEICGGPHVESLENLGRFKIIKEESVSSGVRRIKAILED